MKKLQAEYPAMEELFSLSIGDLVVVYDSREEAEQHIRQQVFGDMRSNIAKHYRALTPANKRIVGKLITHFTEKEHQGFNLAVFLYWIENNQSSDRVEQIALASHIIDASVEDEAFEAYDGMDPQELSDYINTIKHRMTFRGEHLIRKGEDEKRKGTLNLIKSLSNCLLFSPELVLNGYGVLEWVKTETLNDYPELYAIARDDDGTLQVSVRSALYEFAEMLNMEQCDIVDIKYGVINYTYGYRFLEESKDKSKKAIVDYLIEELYSQEQALKKQEQASKKSIEKHKKLFKELYVKVDTDGIRKGDFNTLAVLYDAIHKS